MSHPIVLRELSKIMNILSRPKKKVFEQKHLKCTIKVVPPFEVATQLNISAEYAINYLAEYLKLQGLGDFRKFYEEINGDFAPLVSLNRELQAKGIKPAYVSNALKDVDTRLTLEEEIKDLQQLFGNEREHLARLKAETLNAEKQLSIIRAEIRLMHNAHVNLREENRIYREEKEKHRLEQGAKPW